MSLAVSKKRLRELVSQNSISFFAVSLLCFASWVNVGKMGRTVFFSWDSTSYLAYANDSLGNNGWGIGPSFLQSFGNIQYPDNFRLLPEFLLSSLFRTEVQPQLFYLVTNLLFYWVSYFFMMQWGFPKNSSVITSFCLCILTLPFMSKTLLSNIYWWHSPYSNQAVYLVGIAMIFATKVARSKTISGISLVYLFSSLCSLLYMYMAKPASFPFMLPALLLYFMFLTFKSKAKMQFIFVFILPSFTLAFYLIHRSLDYWNSVSNWAIGTQTNPFAYFYPLNFQQFFANMGTYWTVWFSLLSIFSGLVLLVKVDRERRNNTRVLGGFVCASSAFFALPAMGAIYISQIIFVYFAAICGLMLTVAEYMSKVKKQTLITRNTSINMKKEKKKIIQTKAKSSKTLICSIISLLFLITSMTNPGRIDGFQGNQDGAGALKQISRDLSFTKEADFHGRYMFLLPESQENTFVRFMNASLVSKRNSWSQEFLFSGPQRLNIPLTVEDNRANTVASTLFHRLLLTARPTTSERIDFRTVTSSNLAWLKFIGVKYIAMFKSSIDERLARSSRYLSSAPLANGDSINFYEIYETNIGDYSPQKIIFARNFEEFERIVKSGGFNPEEETVTNDPMMSKWNLSTQARNTKVKRTSNGIKVSASAGGTAAIVLPFEYSKCWKVLSDSGNPAFRIFRANLMWIGIEFKDSLSIELKMNFGLIPDFSCRSSDIAELEAWGIKRDTYESIITREGGNFETLISGAG